MSNRAPNTNSRGGPFDPSTIQAVWNKAQVVSRYDPNVYRKDRCGAWIARANYGKTEQYGWEIDHIKHVAMGGGDEPTNLQPLHWQNNRHKGDNWPNWSCKLAS